MSIRIRLTLLYVSLLGLVLVVFSAAFYSILQFSLTTEIDRALEDRAQQVALSIQAQNNPIDILRSGGISLPELNVFSSRSIYVQIRNANGQVIRSSPNLMNSSLPINQEIFDEVSQGRANLITAEVGAARLRLYTTPLIWNNQTIGMVQVGNPLNGVQETLQQVFLFLVGGTVIALVFATFVGILLAHLSLKPIDEITSTANRIVSAQDLQQRLRVSGTGDELDRLSATINHMMARLEDYFKAQVRFSAEVSHELRTPLTIIRGNVDALRHGVESEQERAEIVSTIESALDRMSRLVSDLLMLSRADIGLTLHTEPLELDGVILDVFQEAHALANGVKLSLGHADQVQVCGDSDRLKQLFINLMENAIKHTPQGGSVTLSVYHEGDTVRVSVADTGEGMAPEHLPHIFDRFYRVKGQKRKGTGLGLAIAKWIAEAHGGTISVESELGIGSTFIVRLPVNRPEAAPQPALNAPTDA